MRLVRNQSQLRRVLLIARVVKFVINGAILFGIVGVFMLAKREYHIKRLTKFGSSPSPFLKSGDMSLNTKSIKNVPEPDDSVSVKYEPPSEDFQKIPFLRKTDTEIYADQLRYVLGSLKRVVRRMENNANETQLAGVVTMKPSEKEQNDVSVKPIDELEDALSERTEETNKMMDALVDRLSSTFKESDLTDSKGNLRPSAKNPMAEILEYRKNYFKTYRELLNSFMNGESLDPNFLNEVDKRVEYHHDLINQLIEYYFATEEDEEAQIEKAFHYSMPASGQYERIVRLETQIFGIEDLENGTFDEDYIKYYNQLGYVYDEYLKTFIKNSKAYAVEKLNLHQRETFYKEMNILLKTEKRMKTLVVQYAKKGASLEDDVDAL